MKVEIMEYINASWETSKEVLQNKDSADIVFIFGETDSFKKKEHFDYLRQQYSQAIIVGCTSSGNVLGPALSDAEITATAVQFDNVKVKLSYIDFNENDNLETLSEQLVTDLASEDLKHIFLLSDGLLINGSQLVRGINRVSNVAVSGGMAGDGDRFQETWVIANDQPKQRRIAAIGFYGDKLTISSSAFGGWSEFGAHRVITRSKGNILYEIDNQPALELYKQYLGGYASDLPNSGLRFPLSIKENDDDPEVIRTLLAIDEKDNSITFAGDVPEGYRARLMKPDIDILIDAASQAAKKINQLNDKQALGLVVSCVGRKIILGPMVDEELEAIEEELGQNVSLTGFYSYGEISPFETEDLHCNLHNQTVTLTVLYEE
ncbi:MAG: FIST C-terminal domain-containing protein [Gammaproteobacteria bacterium]|nr:FIST C-terminal domain-containing protein [Gammaproteobacteria bacterium]